MSTKAPGTVMSGICSTFRRAYENKPSTHSATITMAANTGLWMATRVIHMAQSWCRCSAYGGCAGRRHRLARFLGHHDGLGAFAQVVEACAEHQRVGHEAAQHFDAAVGLVAAAERHGAAQQCAVGDHPDVVLA